MAMLVVTQTENIKALCQSNPALVYRGFMPRFLFVAPDSKVGSRDRRAAILGGGIPHQVQSSFNEPLIRLAEYLDGVEGGILELEMSPEALDAYADCCQDIENRRAPGGDLEGFNEVAGKADLQLEKLIGINWAMHSTVTGDRAPTVTPDLADAAYRQLDFFLDQQGRLYDLLAQAPVEALQVKIEQWCQDNPGSVITRRDLRHKIARKVPIRLFKEALDLLADDGVIRLLEIRDTGGAPSHKVVVP
jgi:hypothetical protein